MRQCYPDLIVLISFPKHKKQSLCALLLSLSFTCTLPLTFAGPQPANRKWIVQWEPVRVINGSPIFFQVTPPVRLESLTGQWLEHHVFFAFDPATKTWFGIAGASLETQPGKYLLALSGKTVDGREVPFTREIVVGKGKYRRISVKVAKRFTEPSAEQLVQIKEDQALKKDVLSHMDPKREWEGGFTSPVSAVVSDVFGTARIFNGETQSMHQGVDYAVPSGTAVKAINTGTVLLARPLFFEGNFVVLDHGQGLLSLYMHLSRLEVKEGEQVSRGQEIALSGGTGRATGPHLHIAVRWQGIYVNPATLLGLKLPDAVNEPLQR